ncbi:MAG: M56 family metallopeptidase, partial [Succinivibrio sp.]
MKDSRLSLHEVIFGSSCLTDTIATEKDRLITLSDLREDVKTFTDFILNFKGENVALCLENAYEFTVAFISCLYAKKVPVLLGNFTKKTIEDDKDKYDILITSLDKDAIKNDNADAFGDKKLSADFKNLASDSRIVLYTSGSTGNAKRIVKTLEVMELEATVFKNTLKRMNINRKIELIITDSVNTPSLIGIFKVKVLLPSNLIDLEDYQLEYIFLHELCHYKRKDNILNYLLVVLQCLHLFNIVVWILFKKIRNDIELACDEKVLSILDKDEHSKYGFTILDVLEKANSSKD